MRTPQKMTAALVSASLLALAALPTPTALAAEPTAPAPPATTAPAPERPALVLTLQQALDLAEARNPGLQAAALQLVSTRAAISAAPANAEVLAPAASAFLQAQYGITIPASAITPQAAGQQAQIAYEQAAAQYYDARQQVRAGALQAYVEWQRAAATISAQLAALERALTQEANVKAALDVGSAAQFDLLQVQAAVAGQQAALIGAQAMETIARTALGQVIGAPLAPGVQPEPNLVRAADAALPADLEGLMAQALTQRPDLRRQALDLSSRRMQAGMAGGTGQTQLQATVAQYEMAVAKARTQVTQAYLAAQGSLEELKAREKALEPAREALRLAELRYEAGIATALEVQAASAAALEAEAGRIQAAANLTLRLLQLRQAIGEL